MFNFNDFFFKDTRFGSFSTFFVLVRQSLGQLWKPRSLNFIKYWSHAKFDQKFGKVWPIISGITYLISKRMIKFGCKRVK